MPNGHLLVQNQRWKHWNIVQNLFRINNKDIEMTLLTTWEILERKLQGWFLINPIRHETLNICLEILRSAVHGLFKETRLASVASTGFA